MKTTLKKGVTRASTNGAPVFPPSPLTAVTRYGPPRRSRVRLVGKILFWLLIVLLVAAGGLAGGVWLWFEHSVSAIRAHSPQAIEAQAALDDVPPPDRPAVAIVIGHDSRLGADKGNSPRSDTIMLVRADPGRKVVSMLSFPRDLVVELAPCKNHPARVAKINEAYTDCGPKGTLQTVRKLTGVPINYMITVNFRGFIRLVNDLGGVYMDVDRRYFNNKGGPGGYARINLHPGYQRLSGNQALSYVRYRHTDSDLYRNARQQEFVKAIKQQVSGLSAASNLRGIVSAITSNVEVGVGGGRPLQPETVLSYARLAYELPSGSFQQVRLANLSENWAFELSASSDEVERAAAAFLNPDPNVDEKAAAVATGRKPNTGRQGPPPSRVTIEVLNGNGVAGAADDAAYLLAKRGYRTANGGNADRLDYFKTRILYPPGDRQAERAARRLAVVFGDAEVAEAPAGTELETTLRVVVGKTFKGTLAPVPRDETPKRQRAAVVKDASLAPRVRRAQRRVDFPLLIPTVRERSSRVSDLEGVRVYKLNGQGAVRIVYNGPSGTDYWGIQQTGWTDAPALQGASVTRRMGGRDYRLFFNGPHLHVVAFEEDGAAYWVTNTLLDGLSNETMLAIAKGLKPVRRT